MAGVCVCARKRLMLTNDVRTLTIVEHGDLAALRQGRRAMIHPLQQQAHE